MSPRPTDRPESNLWKDRLNKETIRSLATRMRSAYPKFDAKAFEKGVLGNHFFDLELKARLDRIAQQLSSFLPADFDRAVKILLKAAPRLGEFENWALTLYIEQNGLGRFEASMAALKRLTEFSTAEFAIRPFIIRYTDQVFPLLHQWVTDENEHVRRLAAEATRPRGVWVAHVVRFKDDPRPVLKLLEKLRADPSRYVQKAVANSLNDISRDNPELFLETIKKWQNGNHPATAWIIKHACRTMIKKGDPGVLAALGFAVNPNLTLSRLEVSPRAVAIGSDVTINATIQSNSKKSQRLVIDYRVHYLKNNGKHLAKVFKLTERTLVPGATVRLCTRHSFKPRSTRKHYPGKHRIELIINGKLFGETDFRLTSG